MSKLWKILFSFLISVTAFGIVPSHLAATDLRPITLQDLLGLGRNAAYYLQVSPDGRRIVYTTWGDAAEGEEPQDNLWVVDARPGSIPQQFGRGSIPQWASDGEHLAFYSQASGTMQLWVMDVKTGQSRQVTHLKEGIRVDEYARFTGSILDSRQYSWSPDGAKLVFYSLVAKEGVSVARPSPPVKDQAVGADPKRGLPLILTTTTPNGWTMHGVYAGSDGALHDPSARTDPDTVGQIFIADVKTGQVEQLTHGDDNYFNPQWSPDGKTIVCVSSDGGSIRLDDFKRTNLYVFGIASKTKLAMTTGDGLKRLPSWSPDGKWIAYFGANSFLGLEQIYVVPASGHRPPKDLTSRFVAKYDIGDGVFHFEWSPDSRAIIVDHSGFFRIDIEDGNWSSTFSLDAEILGEFSMSRTGVLVWGQSTESSHGLIEMMTGNSTSPTLVVNTNPQMKDWAIGTQEMVQWKNSRGDQLEGVLILPAGYKKGHKYPLIIDCYPGRGQYPHAFYYGEMGGNQAFASRGYAVFFPATRAPHVWMNVVRNKEFMEAAKGPRGWDVLVDDIMSGVDELIRQGIVDPDRMGLTGFSNGGGVADYLVTSTPRFKCAVSVAAVLPDWPSAFFFPGNGGSPADLVKFAGINTTPWDDLEGWIKLSAVYRLPNVTTPMLLADGDDDIGFLPGMIEMYQGLRYLGKEVTLLRYEGQGHGFEGPAMADFWRRENEFFDRYLKPETSVD